MADTLAGMGWRVDHAEPDHVCGQHRATGVRIVVEPLPDGTGWLAHYEGRPEPVRTLRTLSAMVRRLCVTTPCNPLSLARAVSLAGMGCAPDSPDGWLDRFSGRHFRLPTDTDIDTNP